MIVNGRASSRPFLIQLWRRCDHIFGVVLAKARTHTARSIERSRWTSQGLLTRVFAKLCLVVMGPGFRQDDIVEAVRTLPPQSHHDLTNHVRPHRADTLATQDVSPLTRRKPRLAGGTPCAQPPARASRMKSVT